MKKLVRLLLILCVFVLLVLGILAASVLTGTGMRMVTLPVINRVQPYTITLEQWHFIPWRSVTAKGITVEGPDTRITCAEAHISYNFRSLLTELPHIHSIEIDTLAVNHRAPREKPIDDAPVPPRPERERPSDRPTREPSRPLRVPLVVEHIHLRNARITYTDTSGERLEITSLSLEGRDISPTDDGTLAAHGVIAYTDAQDIDVKLPFVSDVTYTPSRQGFPLSLEVSASNLVGQVRDIAIAPYSLEIQAHVTGLGSENLTVDESTLRLMREGNAFGAVNATGTYNSVADTASLSVILALLPNPLWDALADVPMIALADMHTDMRADVVWDGSETLLSCALNAAIRDLRWRDEDTAPPVHVFAQLEGNVAPQAASLHLESFAAQVREGTSPRVQIALSEPLDISWNETEPGADARLSDAHISCVITRFPLTRIHAFLPRDAFAIDGGTLSAALRTSFHPEDDAIRLNGTVSLGQLAASHGDAHWHALDVTTRVSTALYDMKKLDVTRITTQLIHHGEPVGDITLGGTFNIDNGAFDIALALARVSGELVRPLLDPARTNPQLDGNEITARLHARTPGDTPDIIALTSALSLRNTRRRTVNDWQSLALDAELEISPEICRISPSSLTLLPAQREENTLHFEGTVPLAPGLNAHVLTIAAPYFDATALLDIFLPDTAQTPAPTRPTAPPPPARTPSPRPAPTPREEKAVKPFPAPLTVAMRIDELHARDMHVTPMALDLILTNTRVRVMTHDMRINEGLVALFADLDRGVPGYTYRVETALTNLPIQPVVATFAPHMRDRYRGLLHADVSLTGAGTEMPAAGNALNGTVRAGLRDGRLTQVPILTDVASAIQLPVLSDLPIGHAHLNATARDGVVSLHECNLHSRTLKAGINGAVPFEGEMNLSMRLALSPAAIGEVLSNNVRFVRLPFERTLHDFIEIPTPIVVRGTMTSPNVRVSTSAFVAEIIKVIGGTALDTFTDFIPEGEVRDTIRDGIRTLEGIFRRPQESPPPSRP